VDRRMARCSLAVILSLAATIGSAGAEEAPTMEDARESCRAAANERTELVQAGVLELVGRGAAWGRTSAMPDQIARVRRYIALQERLMFDCPVGYTATVHAGPMPPPPVRRPHRPPSGAAKPSPAPEIPLPVAKKAVL
jgi:hypothetical protein